MTDTNTGPVLPRLPDHDGWSDRPYWQASSMFTYGRQCAEHVAGPLIEANASLSEANASLQNRVAELEKQRDAAFAMSRCECGSEEACANLVASAEELARLRAENKAKDRRITELQSMLRAARAAREG